MDWIKEIFENATEEQVKAVKKAVGESFIPKSDYKKKVDQLNEELDITKNTLNETSTKLTEFEKSAGQNDELVSELQKTKTELETFKSESDKRYLDSEKRHALEKHLGSSNANPDSIDLLTGQFDLEKIQLDNSGNIVDWEDTLKPIKEARSSLFGKVTTETTPPDKAGGEPGDDDSALWAAIGVPKPQ